MTAEFTVKQMENRYCCVIKQSFFMRNFNQICLKWAGLGLEQRAQKVRVLFEQQN